MFLYIHEISAAAAASAYERTDEDTDGIILVEDGPGFRCNVSTLAPSTSHPKGVDIIKYSYGKFRSHLSMYGEPAGDVQRKRASHEDERRSLETLRLRDVAVEVLSCTVLCSMTMASEREREHDLPSPYAGIAHAPRRH